MIQIQGTQINKNDTNTRYKYKIQIQDTKINKNDTNTRWEYKMRKQDVIKRYRYK